MALLYKISEDMLLRKYIRTLWIFYDVRHLVVSLWFVTTCCNKKTKLKTKLTKTDSVYKYMYIYTYIHVLIQTK